MTKTRIEVDDIDTRLAELGLEADKLTEVVRRGYLAFVSSSPNDPPLFPGFSAWAMMVRGLREYLLPIWERSDDNNYSLVINQAGTVAIAVATGDDATGRQGKTPTTKSAKGPSTVGAVTSNQMQLDLPGMTAQLPTPAGVADTDDQRMTWLLLVHRSVGEVRCELSLPTSMGIDGRVDGWRERIILGAIPTDQDAVDITPPSPLQPDIDVDVKRRA